MMERTLALARHTTIEVDDLPIRIRDGFGDVLLPSMMRNDTLRAWGSRYVRLVLERSGRNKRKACRALGISYHTLAGVFAICAPAAGGQRARNLTGLLGRELGRTHPAQPDRRKRGTAGAVRVMRTSNLSRRRALARGDHPAEGEGGRMTYVSDQTVWRPSSWHWHLSLPLPQRRATGMRTGSEGAIRNTTLRRGPSFTATTDAAGNAVLTLKGGDFVLEKVVAHTGDATLRLSQGKDVVTIALNQSGFHVAQRAEVDSHRPAHRQTRQARRRPLAPRRLAGRSIVQAAGCRTRAARRERGRWSAGIEHARRRRHRAAARWRRRRTAAYRKADHAEASRVASRRQRETSARRVSSTASATTRSRSCRRTASSRAAASSRTHTPGGAGASSIELCAWEWAIRSQQYIWQFIGCFMLPW